MDKPITLSAVMDLILGQWRQTGMLLSENELAQIHRSLASGDALSDAVVARINEHTLRHTPAESAPEWLNDIDDFFQQPADSDSPGQVARNTQYAAAFVDVCMLLTPLVYFDDILKMQSFDDDFLARMELAFITRLEAPRSVEEARRMYALILGLPNAYVRHTALGRQVAPQPFKAQMCFAALIAKPSAPHSALWTFQRECLEQCPMRLLDYPDDGAMGYSARPAFWMAYYVRDPTFREILLRRGNDRLRQDFATVFAYERKRAAASADLSTEMPLDQRPLADRAPAAQHELVALLHDLDVHLAEHAQDIYGMLRPGVCDDQIDKLHSLLTPLKLPEDLVTLYKWRNGIAPGGFLFGFPDFAALEEAWYFYREALEAGAQFSWCTAWFPLSCDNNVRLLVPLSEETAQEAPILYHDSEGGDIEVHHESLMCMIKTYLQAYQEKVVYFDVASGCWEIHEDRFDAIRLQHSPQGYRYPDRAQWAYDVWDTSQWPALWKKYWIGQAIDL